MSASRRIRGKRRLGIAVAVSLALALAGTVAVTPVQPQVADAASKTTTRKAATIDTSNRQAVADAYNNILLPALATNIDWTGSVDDCNPGTISAESQTATLAAVNYMRSLAGLSPVKFDAVLSAKAQTAAVVYEANLNLSHQIPSTWKCFTATAYGAGLKSNLALGDGLAGAQAILGYMDEPGAGNNVVGHRRWILNPEAKTMGSGSTPLAEVLYVRGATTKKFNNPTWVQWPTAGYFPEQLEPAGRWSFTANNRFNVHSTFAKAKVTVTSPSGKKLKVKIENRSNYNKAGTLGQGYANDTLVFHVAGVKGASGGSVATYTVKITGIKVGKKTKSYSYKVKLFDPTSH